MVTCSLQEDEAIIDFSRLKGKGRGGFNAVLAVAKDGAFATKDKFAQNQQGEVGPEVAGVGGAAKQAAHVNALLLPAPGPAKRNRSS